MNATGRSSFPLADLLTSNEMTPFAIHKEKFANGSATAIAVVNEVEVVQNSNTGNIMEHVENADDNMRSEIVR